LKQTSLKKEKKSKISLYLSVWLFLGTAWCRPNLYEYPKQKHKQSNKAAKPKHQQANFSDIYDKNVGLKISDFF
jgi:hypothetical protein